MKQWLFFGCGFFAGMVTLSLSFASVPKSGQMTDNTAIYQAPTEITVPKQQKLDFDNDIGRLSEMEGRYQEKNLSPLARNPRIAAPMKRVSQQKYVYSGNKRAAAVQPVQQRAAKAAKAAQRPAAQRHVVPAAAPAPAKAAKAPGIPVSQATILPTAPLAAPPSMGVPEEPTLRKLDLGRPSDGETGGARKALR